MKKSQFLLFAIFVGVQSFLLQVIDQLLSRYVIPFENSGFVFIGFFGWALYFLLGGNLKGGAKVFGGYIMGIFFAIIMFFVAGAFKGTGMFAVPIAALLVVPMMMYFEYAPKTIGNVSVFFLGAGAFYAIFNYVSGATMVSTTLILLTYCLLGLASGWGTVTFRTWYEKRLGIKKK